MIAYFFTADFLLEVEVLVSASDAAEYGYVAESFAEEPVFASLDLSDARVG